MKTRSTLKDLDTLIETLVTTPDSTVTLDTETRHTLAWIGVSLDSIADSLKTLVEIEQESRS